MKFTPWQVELQLQLLHYWASPTAVLQTLFFSNTTSFLLQQLCKDTLDLMHSNVDNIFAVRCHLYANLMKKLHTLINGAQVLKLWCGAAGACPAPVCQTMQHPVLCAIPVHVRADASRHFTLYTLARSIDHNQQDRTKLDGTRTRWARAKFMKIATHVCICSSDEARWASKWYIDHQDGQSHTPLPALEIHSP